MEGSTPHLHHNTVALWERAKELDQQENQHSEAISALTLLQSSTSSTILSQSFTSLLLIATIILYFLVWATSCHILPHLATTCHDWALAGRWVSIKWRGLTPHLHHKQGWISIKWRGLTPHLHHNTVALWERAEELEQQGSEPVLRSHLSSHSSAKFYFLYYPFTSLLPSLLTSWFGQPPATSCHDMPRLGPC